MHKLSVYSDIFVLKFPNIDMLTLLKNADINTVEQLYNYSIMKLLRIMNVKLTDILDLKTSLSMRILEQSVQVANLTPIHIDISKDEHFRCIPTHKVQDYIMPTMYSSGNIQLDNILHGGFPNCRVIELLDYLPSFQPVTVSFDDQLNANKTVDSSKICLSAMIAAAMSGYKVLYIDTSNNANIQVIKDLLQARLTFEVLNEVTTPMTSIPSSKSGVSDRFTQRYNDALSKISIKPCHTLYEVLDCLTLILDQMRNSQKHVNRSITNDSINQDQSFNADSSKSNENLTLPFNLIILDSLYSVVAPMVPTNISSRFSSQTTSKNEPKSKLFSTASSILNNLLISLSGLCRQLTSDEISKCSILLTNIASNVSMSATSTTSNFGHTSKTVIQRELDHLIFHECIELSILLSQDTCNIEQGSSSQYSQQIQTQLITRVGKLIIIL